MKEIQIVLNLIQIYISIDETNLQRLLDTAREHVKAKNKRIGQSFTILSSPKSNGQIPLGLNSIDIDLKWHGIQTASRVECGLLILGVDTVSQKVILTVTVVFGLLDLFEESVDWPGVFEFDVGSHRCYHFQV